MSAVMQEASTAAGALDGATDALVSFVVEAATAPLPAEVEHHVRRLLVDYMAAVVPGSSARKMWATSPG